MTYEQPPPGQPAPSFQPYGTPPYAGQQPQAQAAPPTASPLSADGVEKARSCRSWMKMMGIVSIVMGAFYCLSLAGAVVGWLPILMGVWMLRAGDGIGTYAETGHAGSLETGIGNLRNIYMAAGITFFVGLGLGVLGAIAYVVAIAGVIGLAATQG